ncbi:GNAT family N-acetyltransferase [Streptomyces sp. ACA25]|uniref:GNAT family N-acetyltransferase n=1 Tax=Streptomyces sp. ACA25 TaxID=3022596 RepID=UPI002307BF06|nr:GNAT family N-acetyltransferase [Streptomyces sp. ACA25]MDB1088681.1 GNAT family N-acetyltransferase [Streptomyces sp. ACA25]
MADEVLLRDAEETDIPVFFRHQLDTAARCTAAFTAKNPTDEEAFGKKWRKILANEAWTKRTILVDGAVAGHVVVYEQEGDLEVTYWIGKEHWGRGIASEALAAILGEVTDRPLFGRTAFDNVASQKVLQRHGFVLLDEEVSYANGRGEDVRELVFRLDA